MQRFNARVLAVGAASLTVVCRPAWADWPVQRHDPARAGLAAGSSDLANPVPYLDHYLGGGLRATELNTHDADGDGVDDAVFVTGGRVVARRSDDSIIWSTPPLAATNLVGLTDLDGDTGANIVLYARRGAIVLSATAGGGAGGGGVAPTPPQSARCHQMRVCCREKAHGRLGHVDAARREHVRAIRERGKRRGTSSAALSAPPPRPTAP